MSKVLILYYSSYGHVETMAAAVADGVRAAGGEATIKRVAETVPEDVARNAGFQLAQPALEATVEELGEYDAIVVGTGTRFGRMSAQMCAFWDQAGRLWSQGVLHGKVGAAFTCSGSQHGGQETTLFSILTNLLHFGMVIVGLDYGFQGQLRSDEIVGGSPYGATTIAGADGSRQPSETELESARYLGRRVADMASRLAA